MNVVRKSAMPKAARFTLAILIGSTSAQFAFSAESELDRQTRRAREECEAIPASRYVTGLIGSGHGSQTYFDRSVCFLRLAVLIRASELCEQVIERKSVLFDGSDFTRSRCLHDVGKVIDQDISMARRLGARQRIDRIDLRQNGNGRDYDVVIATSGGAPGSYRLAISLIDKTGAERTLHANPQQPMGTDSGSLNILVRRSSVDDAMGGELSRDEAMVRISLELTARTLDNRAVYSHLPGSDAVSTADACFDFSRAAKCARR